MQRINDISLFKFRLKQSPAISLLFPLIIISFSSHFPFNQFDEIVIVSNSL